MAYKKQNFIDGYTVLAAEHLKHMEDGIYQNSLAIEQKEVTDEQIEQIVLDYMAENPVKVTGVVKSVNGETPDANGNVTITIPESSESEGYVTQQVVKSTDYKIVGFCRPVGTFGTTDIYVRTDYIDISLYKTLTIHCQARTNSVSPCVWFDENKTYISGIEPSQSELDERDFTVEVPDGAVYAVFSSTKAIGASRSVTGTISGFDARVNACLANAALDQSGDVKINLLAEQNSVIKKVSAEKLLAVDMSATLVKDEDFSIAGFCRADGTLGTNTSYCRTDYIDVSRYKTITVHCRPKSDAVAPSVWFDEDMNYISGESVTKEQLTEADFTYNVPEGAYYAIFSSATLTGKKATGIKIVSFSDVAVELQNKLDKVTSGQRKCYISPTGSDDNRGRTADEPVLTIAKAIELLAEDGELVFMEGDYENLVYDLSSFAKVSTDGNARLVYFTDKFTEATLVSGYTRVYSVPYTGSYSDYLWQFDVPDANTAISASERHPLQRNRSHRLEHTRLYPVTKFDSTSTALSGYLGTMESITNRWMYYMDGTNCYFTAPSADFDVNPIVIPSKTVLKASEKKNVNISSLKIYFASILTTNLSGVLDSLTVGYHNQSGAIMWDNTFNLTLNNCEVAASTNDGINGHTSGDITCYNCWGHDCSDDGESDHEACHIIQYGGLYEYNGNGCTPASGASGEYINTICRNNNAWDWVSDPAGTGFSAQNTSTTEPALMYCLGCYTYGCKIGFRQKSTSKATFINCVSKGDDVAFGDGVQIDCSIDGEDNGGTGGSVVPEIGDNGNWYINDEDTGKPSVGNVTEAVIQQVIATLATPVFGSVDEDNNIILSGKLASGTYTLKYEGEDGSLVNIGTLVHSANQSGYTNLANPDSSDWLTSYRIKSDMSIVSDDNSSSPNTFVTNYIPVKSGDVVRVKGLNIRIASAVVGSVTNTRSLLCDSSKTAIGSVVPNNVSAMVENGDMWTWTVPDGVSGIDTSQIAYVRFNGTLYSGYTKDDVVITVNEMIQ